MSHCVYLLCRHRHLDFVDANISQHDRITASAAPYLSFTHILAWMPLSPMQVQDILYATALFLDVLLLSHAEGETHKALRLPAMHYKSRL